MENFLLPTWATISILILMAIRSEISPRRNPLFSYVNSNDFTKYHFVHMEKITPLVSIVMVLEVVVAFGLLFYTPTISGFILAINLFLVGFIWISTAFLQIPYHRSLAFPTNRIFYTKKLINIQTISKNKNRCQDFKNSLLL